MAVKTAPKTAAAKATEAPAFASNLPEDMLQGGLKDDFDGVIEKARYVPWDYNGSLDHHVLAVALTIRPEGEEPFVQHYSAGDLENFVPAAEDGTLVDLDNGEGEDLEGVAARRVGKKEQMSSSSNWAAFVSAALDAGFPRTEVSPLITFIEGTSAHFNRIPQKKRSGIVSQAAGGDEKTNRSKDILVITEYKGKAAGGAKAAAKAAPKTAAPAAKAAPAAAAAPAGGSLEERVEAVIAGAATAEGVEKSVITSAIMKGFGGAEKAKALQLLNKSEFLEGASAFAFDPDEAKFYSV